MKSALKNCPSAALDDSLAPAELDARLESGEILLSPETPSRGIGSGFTCPIPQPGGSGENRRFPPLRDHLSRALAGALHLGSFLKRSDRGFTLLEMILVIAFMGLMTSMAFLLFKPVLDIWSLDSPRGEVTDSASYALSRMSYEMTQVKDKTSVITATSNRFRFLNVSDQNLDYQLTGNNLTRNGNVLAQGVQSLTLTYYDQSNNTIAAPQVSPTATNIWRIQIEMTTQKEGQTVSLKSDVHPRNFPRT